MKRPIAMSNKQTPQQNCLLAALSDDARARLFPHLELTRLPLGKVLYESGDTLRHIYFPTDCIVSLLYVMEDRASAEIAVVGNEGVIGVALFMGGRGGGGAGAGGWGGRRAGRRGAGGGAAEEQAPP